MKPWKQIQHDILGFFLRTNNNEQFFYKLKFTIMKKVLTLVSALSMVAGSAFAHDYSWSVDKTPSTDKNGVVENTKGMLKYDGTKFTFIADADDVVTVDVNNSNATSTMIVVIGGVKNEVKEGTAVKLTQKVNAGEVAIEVTGTGYVTKIAVESQAYRDANAAVKNAQDVLNAKNAETAKYASDFSEFFTSVRGELNKQGVKIEKLIADLKGYKNEDQVSVKLAGFKADLSKIEADIAQIVTDADAAMTSYKAIVDGQNAKDAQTAINNAKKTELAADALTVSADKKSVTNNGTSGYIYNFKPEVKNNTVVKLVKSSAKRDWVDSEMAKVQAELDNTKAAALKSLNAFPKHFTAEKNESAADFNAKFDKDKAYVANLVARANVEVAHADHITTLASDVKTLDAALAAGFDKTSLGGYDAWKVTVDELSKAIAKTDNRYKVTAAELTTTISDKCDAAVTSQTSYRKNIIGQSYTKLTAKLAGVQTLLNDYSYKVSAKYQNEPETQKKYELEFAKIQNELNSIKAGYLNNDVDDAKLPTAWTNMVEQYSTRVSALDTQKGNIETLWKATQSAQKDKVTELNKQKANELYATIDDARAYYDAQVLKINGYKTFEPTKSIADKIDVRLKNLFDIVLKLEQTKSDITKELTKCNENVAVAPDVEFDQTKDEYRFNKNKWLTEDKTTDVVGGIKTEIVTEVKAAIDEANKATYAYLYDANNDGTEAFATVTGMQHLINVAKDKVQTGADNKEMSAAAAASFKTAYDEIADKFEVINKVKTQVGKIEVAKAKIGELTPGGVPTVDAEVPAEGKVAKNLVDQIAAINAQTLDLVPAAIKGVDTELTSYKEQYKAIGKLKVDWSVAKADIANLYLKAKEADASLDETTFEKRLDAVNTAVTEISADLEKKATSATTVAEATAEKLAKQTEELKIINNYPLYVANNKAYDEANKLHKEVSDALAAAKTAVEALKDNVKAEFMPQLTAFDGKLAAESTALNAKNEDWTAQASNLAAVKTNLEAYKTQIADILKAAQEANKVDESLDYNKDGEINDLDQRAVLNNVVDGVVVLDTYFDWLNKFINYQKENK